MAQPQEEMKSPLHATFIFPSCPLLPEVGEVLRHAVTREHADQKGPDFYLATLRYSQSLWREGKPAQAILQLNKAFMSDLRGDEEVLQRHPPPYAVLLWFLRHRPEGYFIGNPVRHFQHLATRMSGERKEIRAWRAWACYHLSQAVLPADEFPIDEEQVAEEGIVFPEWNAVTEAIGRLGWSRERTALEACAPQQMP